MSKMKKSNTGLIILIGVLIAAIVFLVLLLIPLKNMHTQNTQQNGVSKNSLSAATAAATVSDPAAAESADTVSPDETVSSCFADFDMESELKYIDDVCKYTDSNIDSYSVYQEFKDASGTKFRDAQIYVDEGGYPVKMAFNPDSSGLKIVSYFINRNVDGRSVIEPYYYDNNLVYLYATDGAGKQYSIYIKGERDVASPLGRVIAYSGSDGKMVQFPGTPNFNDFLKKYSGTDDAAVINTMFNTAAPKWDILFTSEESGNSVN